VGVLGFQRLVTDEVIAVISAVGLSRHGKLPQSRYVQ
jgi:hypothetical protein